MRAVESQPVEPIRSDAAVLGVANYGVLIVHPVRVDDSSPAFSAVLLLCGDYSNV
jgi:hypothetical protein